MPQLDKLPGLSTVLKPDLKLSSNKQIEQNYTAMNLNKNNCDKEILGSGNAQTAVVREGTN